MHNTTFEMNFIAVKAFYVYNHSVFRSFVVLVIYVHNVELTFIYRTDHHWGPFEKGKTGNV